MARSNSGTIVAGLTAAALAAVGFLAYQAAATAPHGLAKDRPGHSAASGRPGSPAQSTATPEPKRHPLPANSGTGKRVVYALGERRVWLVGADGTVTRTFPVVPSTVSPAPGQYAVASRSASVTGSDNVPVEHVVRFTVTDGVMIGFSAAVDGSMPDPQAEKRTGGIRENRADGAAMWAFATVGTKVVVVA